MSPPDRNIAEVGNEMVAAGLPSSFVLRVLELARESEGVEDLVFLWADAPDADERGEVEADLHAAIEDRDGAVPEFRVESTDEADRILGQRRACKKHLRDLVEAHGGVTAVARRAEMPQPSLSRLLNSMSEPRPATLVRLASAMDLPVEALNQDPRPADAPARPRVEVSLYRSAFIGVLEGTRYGFGRRLCREAR